MYKSDIDKLKYYIEYLKIQHNFRGPLHLTDFSNLKNIFSKKYLLSRGNCNKNGIKFLDAADQDVIEHTSIDVINSVRFYYKEKTPMLYNNEGIKINDEKPHVPIPVYLLFDNELLYLKMSKFADGNAKSSKTRFGDNYDFFSRIDWEKVFHRGPISGGQFYKSEVKRKRHAELLCTEPVPLKYLNKIIFRCETDKKRAVNIFGPDERYVVGHNYFNSEKNYIENYKIDISKDGRRLIISRKFNGENFRDYAHTYKIYNKNGELVQNEVFPIPDGTGKVWQMTTKKIPKDSCKFEYYMDKVLCVEEYLSK